MVPRATPASNANTPMTKCLNVKRKPVLPAGLVPVTFRHNIKAGTPASAKPYDAIVANPSLANPSTNVAAPVWRAVVQRAACRMARIVPTATSIRWFTTT